MQDVLYHYCPLEAFRRIIQSKEIWLTNIFCMNDAAEHYWLRRIAQRVLENSTDLQGDLRDAILRKLFPPEEETDLYCCCFSRKWDLLSQWRAYADDGRGVAIGFSIYFLRDHCRNHFRTRLEKVLYDRNEQEKIAKRISKRMPHDTHLSAGSLPPELVAEFPALHAKVKLWSEAARCKNRFFREEREFRLIYDPSIDQTSPTMGQRQFRSRGDTLVPYYALPLPTDTRVFRRIVFGPKSAYKHNEKVARTLLSESGFNLEGIDFCHSKGTYR